MTYLTPEENMATTACEIAREVITLGLNRAELAMDEWSDAKRFTEELLALSQKLHPLEQWLSSPECEHFRCTEREAVFNSDRDGYYCHRHWMEEDPSDEAGGKPAETAR